MRHLGLPNGSSDRGISIVWDNSKRIRTPRIKIQKIIWTKINFSFDYHNCFWRSPFGHLNDLRKRFYSEDLLIQIINSDSCTDHSQFSWSSNEVHFLSNWRLTKVFGQMVLIKRDRPFEKMRKSPESVEKNLNSKCNTNTIEGFEALEHQRWKVQII